MPLAIVDDLLGDDLCLPTAQLVAVGSTHIHTAALRLGPTSTGADTHCIYTAGFMVYYIGITLYTCKCHIMLPVMIYLKTRCPFCRPRLMKSLPFPCSPSSWKQNCFDDKAAQRVQDIPILYRAISDWTCLSESVAHLTL